MNLLRALLAGLLLGLASVTPSAADAPRPQLSAVQAAALQRSDYLGDWRPGGEAPSSAEPAAIVAADGSGTHRSLQAALDAVAPGATVWLRPGIYRGAVCIRRPVRLIGQGDAAAIRVVDGRYAAQPKPADTPAHPCLSASAAPTVGTAGSSTLVVASHDVQLQGFTVANDALDGVRAGQGYPAGAGESGGAQAVALMTRGDRIRLERMRVLGHQDSLFADRPPGGATARVWVHRSLVAGDVDFIFGAATLVIEDSLVLSRAGRRAPGEQGIGLAPSTAPQQAHGFLLLRSRWLAEPGVAPGSVFIGRAWDAGVPKREGGAAWQAGVSPNGQALVRDSLLGPHLKGWTRSTAWRPFDAGVNRLAEFDNALLPAAAWETLPANEGWGGGTRGGADAAPEQVLAIRDRAELEAALRLGATPKILALMARIDLSADAQGRPLDAAALRDAQYDEAAYRAAFDPATWGRRAPAGPLEEARQRSATRQARQVTLRLPSNTTLIGVRSGAGFANGMLVADGVEQLILRHLHFSDAYDHFPAWDPLDGSQGEWNSEYDNLRLRAARQVWVDHCRFDDGARPDTLEPVVFGRRVQRHDGLLDVTHGADRITLSWNHFRQHDKSLLIGNSDKQLGDAGLLRVTLHHNRFEGLRERQPRVRFGQVHVLNNLYELRGDGDYPFAYALGIGLHSQILSQGNVFEGPAQAARLLRVFKGERFLDEGSQLNDAPLDLAAAFPQLRPVDWRPPYTLAVEPALGLAPRVRSGAGPQWPQWPDNSAPQQGTP